MDKEQARKFVDRYIPSGKQKAISKQDLMQLIGADERQLRNLISSAREFIPIINLQNGKGFYEPNINNQEDVLEAKLFLKQEEKRISALKKSIKAVKEFCKEYERN